MFLFTSAAAAIIFRAELSILLGFIVLGQLVTGRLNILAIICCGLPAAICMLGMKYSYKLSYLPENVDSFYTLMLIIE